MICLKKFYSLLIAILFIFTSNAATYAYGLVPQKATDTEGEELHSEMSFEYISQQATAEIISIASGNDGLIYILKQLTVEEKQIDVYNENGIYCSSILFETDGTCGLLEIENVVYLYYVRGQFAFLLHDGIVTESLYYFDENSSHLVHNNYSQKERTYPFGKITMSSGNILLSFLSYNTKVEIVTQKESIVICDSTKYCTNQLIVMFLLVFTIASIVIIGVVYQVKEQKRNTRERQGTV